MNTEHERDHIVDIITIIDSDNINHNRLESDFVQFQLFYSIQYHKNYGPNSSGVD